MLGVGKAVPAQFFADMQLRIYSANAPPAKRSIGYFSSKIANNLRGFELLPLAKKKDMTFGHVFLFGFQPPKAASTLRYLNAQGGGAAPPPRFLPAAKTLVRRTRAAAQKGRRALLAAPF